ncbi:MAG: hypothetical protein WBE26_04755 [Phycisphaerae bacterium]
MKEEDVNVCEQCGASVYKEHVQSGIAQYKDGKLYCAHCVTEFEHKHDAVADDAIDDFAPIELDKPNKRDRGEIDMSSSRISTMTDTQIGKSVKDEEEFKRPLQPDGKGATRCRTFHCRISEGAVDFMNKQVNEWIDGREDITIKLATSVIGMFEGKHTEPNIILTVFY